MLDTMMKKLAEELGLEGALATEVPGVYNFPVDEGLAVILSEIPYGFALSSTLTKCPKNQEEELYSAALLANLFGNGTDRCLLGLDTEGNQLTLSREIDYNIEYKEFRDILEDFINTAEFWRDEARAYGTNLE